MLHCFSMRSSALCRYSEILVLPWNVNTSQWHWMTKAERCRRIVVPIPIKSLTFFSKQATTHVNRRKRRKCTIVEKILVTTGRAWSAIEPSLTPRRSVRGFCIFFFFFFVVDVSHNFNNKGGILYCAADPPIVARYIGSVSRCLSRQLSPHFVSSQDPPAIRTKPRIGSF